MSAVQKKRVPKVKPTPTAVPEENESDPDPGSNFEEELCWCIRQLDLSLQKRDKLSVRKASEAEKWLKVLTNPKNPLAKKRMAMRAALGDYREKMSKDTAFAESRRPKITSSDETQPPPNSRFFKESRSKLREKNAVVESESLSDGVSLPASAGRSVFKFNFSLPADVVENPS